MESRKNSLFINTMLHIATFGGVVSLVILIFGPGPTDVAVETYVSRIISVICGLLCAILADW